MVMMSDLLLAALEIQSNIREGGETFRDNYKK